MSIVRDYSALQGRPPRAKRRERAERGTPRALVVAMIAITAVPPAAMLTAFALDAPDWVVVFVLFASFYLVIVLVSVAGRRAVHRNDPIVEDAALAAFARANGLAYTMVNPLPRYPGVLFARPRRTANVVDRIHTTSGRYVEIGNLDFSDDVGEDSWGFVAIHLDQRLPHLVLSAERASRRLPVDVADTQQLRLEGDFSDHFTLYAPAEFQRDALYVFAPDLMVLFIDELDDLHAEIVDDWFFVYSSTDFRGADAALMERLFLIIGLVGAKMQRQTRSYTGVVDRSRRARRGASRLRVTAPEGLPQLGWIPMIGLFAAFALLVTRLAP